MTTKFDKFIQSNKKADIVIIGGGPVGMMTAIALLEFKNPRIKSITILEKRKNFTREQIVVIGSRFHALDKETLRETTLPKKFIISSKLKNELSEMLKNKGGCYVKEPFLTLDATCFRNESSLISSPLKIIEETLLEMLERRINKRENKIKVKIINSVDTFTKINDNYNTIIYTKNGKEYDLKYDILIGTDGKNSIVKNKFKKYFKEIIIIPESQNIFSGVFVFKIDPKDIITSPGPGMYDSSILFNIHERESKDKKIFTEGRRQHKIFPQQRVRIFQHKQGYVYIGVSLTKEEFNELDKTKTIPETLFKKIQSYLAINKITVTKKTPINFSFFPIIVSQVIKPFYFSNNAVYFLGGDAAVNTHFFTASGLDFGLNLSIEGTVKQIEYILNEARDSKEAENKFIEDFIDFDSAYSVKLENMYSPPRVSLDFSEITRKCEKMTKKELIELGKTYALDSLKSKENKSLLDMLDKTELCYLLIDESIKNPFGNKHSDIKGVFPNFGTGEENEEILKEWTRIMKENRSFN